MNLTMANLEQLGGYECRFVKLPPEAFQTECPICLNILRDPHQARCCGKCFCSSCLKGHQQSQKRLGKNQCPTCGNDDLATFEDKRHRQSLEQLQVYCSHQQHGCEWTGELGGLDRHLNKNPAKGKEQEGCPYVEIKCIHCQNAFQRVVHPFDQCPLRIVPCINKRKGCDWQGKFRNLEQHIKIDCQLVEVECEFKHVGWNDPTLQKDLNCHCINNINQHMISPDESRAQTEDNVSNVEIVRTQINELHRTQQQRIQGNQQQNFNTNLLVISAVLMAVLVVFGTLVYHHYLQPSDDITKSVDEKQRQSSDLEKLTEKTTSLEHAHTDEWDGQNIKQVEDFQEPMESLNQSSVHQDHQSNKSDHQTLTGKSFVSLNQSQEKTPQDDKQFHIPEEEMKVPREQFNTTMLHQIEQDLQVLIASLNQSYLGDHHQLQQSIGRISTLMEKNLNQSLQKTTQDVWTTLQMLTEEKTSTLFKEHHRLLLNVMNAFNCSCLPLYHCVRELQGFTYHEFTLRRFSVCQVKNADGDWWSEPFYSPPQGYKFRLDVKTNGDDSVRNDSMSVCLFRVKGCCDDQLTLPVNVTAHIQLVNQLGDHNHHERTVTRSWEKNETLWSHGQHISEYIKLSELEINIDKNTQYLKEDSLHIRVYIKTE